MKINKVILSRHVLAWGIFIVYELALIHLTTGLSASVLRYALYYLCNVLLFYFNAHVILDYAVFKTRRPYLTAGLLILLEIIAYLFIKVGLDDLFAGRQVSRFTLNLINAKLWLSNAFREIFFIGFSIAYWSVLYMMRYREKNHQMEREHLSRQAYTLELQNRYMMAENAYLQNQISPHLLFNSLNFIYNAIHNLSARAGRGIMLLSDIMRYSLLSSQDNRVVEIKQEIEQIENLLELSRLRYKSAFFLKLTRSGRTKGILILPLILITLVENMIKHGDLGDRSHPGSIKLTVNKQLLIFETRNKKRVSSPHLVPGIGLSNIQKRLNNFYPGKHSFEINEDVDSFNTLLTLAI